ncbi:MAG: hypothetical protein ACPG5B_08930 [Chitinophagales bacterium]
MKLTKTTLTITLLLLISLSLTTYGQNRRNQQAKNNKTKTKQKTNVAQKSNGEPLKFKLKKAPKIAVSEIFESMSQGQKPGLKVNIPDGNLASVTANWRKYIKTYDGRVKAKRDEIVATKSMIEDISDTPINIYTKIEAFSGGVLLKAFFDLDSVYLTKKINQAKFNVAANILQDFAVTESATGMQLELKWEEEKLLKLSNDRKALQAREIDLLQRLEGYKKAMKQAEIELKETKKQQELKNKATQNQVNIVEQLRHNLKSVFTKRY